MLGIFHLSQSVGMVAVKMREKHIVDIRWLQSHLLQMLVDGLAFGDSALVDLIKQERTKRFDLGFPVVFSLGRHVSVPPRIEEYLALRMFNQVAEHSEPYPLRFMGCYTGCFDDAAIVAAKGQIRRYSYLACPQNVYFYLFHDLDFSCKGTKIILNNHASTLLICLFAFHLTAVLLQKTFS